MKYYIITTILALMFGGCVIGLIQLYYEREQIQKNYDMMYQDTPIYYKQYHKNSVLKKHKPFVIDLEKN